LARSPETSRGIGRLVALRPGAIGDTLVALPALLALRRRFPRATIELAGNAAVLPLVEASGVVDRSVVFDDPRVTRLFIPGPPGPDDYFLHLDAAVAWGRDPHGALRAALTQRGASHVVVAPSRPPPGARIHVARHLIETLEPLGIDGGRALELPAIRLSGEAEEMARAELEAAGLAGRPFVAVHAGSGSAAKNWPATSFAWVVEALARQRGLATVLLAGPADADVLVSLGDDAGLTSPALVDRPLSVVAAVLRRAAGFLGNDSGLAHLAGQLGVPTLALFGPTDPAVWSPLGPRVRTVRAEPLASLPAERVLAELLALIGDGSAPD
jgi:ADP-heptose:LPS heptosyltransferase